MAELAEGARLLSECGVKTPPRVRIPLSPPISLYVTTHVVRLKLFRLKAEGVRRARLPYFSGDI